MSVGTGSFSQIIQAILKFTSTIHVDHIDLVAVRNHNCNIRVGNTPDVLTDAGMAVPHLYMLYIRNNSWNS
jgi:lactate dehydrogenase-like 2-hydroxyacid dehydrogenase